MFKRERYSPFVEVFSRSIFYIHDQRVEIVSETEKLVSNVSDRRDSFRLFQGFLKYFWKIF